MKLLFVCLGNICRSPTAQAVFEKNIQQQRLPFICDSAGTAAYHIGKQPDQRSQERAKKRGLTLSGYQARQVVIEDFYEFDVIFAMDKQNYLDLQAIAPNEAKARLVLFLQSVDCPETDMPDPYYGAGDGFENVLDLCELGSEYWLQQLC